MTSKQSQKSDLFEIKYDKQFIATEKTSIFFKRGCIDLESVFFKGEANDNQTRRLFVADTNVYALDALRSFFGRFSKQIKFDFKNATLFNTDENSKDALIVIKAGEEYKTIESVLEIAKAALSRAFSRKDVFVAIGGGVVCDMTAFAASIYKRGARCCFVPTTLLAMVDAAVGGKTGCDFDEYKNMIGAFFPAETLFVFPEFVQSLSEAEFRSGFAEAVKTALLYDKEMFEKIRAQRESVKNRESDFVFELIQRCVEAKAKVVQADLLEKNIRMELNLGHTFAHALETCAGLGRIAHGDAVAWGIARALELSQNLGLCSAEYKNEVTETLKYFGWETGKKHSAFSAENSAERLVEAMTRDKKNSSEKIRLVLQKDICSTVILEVENEEILKCL